jgi:hypothetical protein
MAHDELYPGQYPAANEAGFVAADPSEPTDPTIMDALTEACTGTQNPGTRNRATGPARRTRVDRRTEDRE